MAASLTKEALASQRMASPRLSRSRTQSMSSDRPSTISHSIMSPPLSVSPEAAFIAASAASQIVTNDHDSHAHLWYDQSGIEPAGETALVSNSALQLVNNFLDNLLFSFLHVSKATTLSALRPAVTEVLKPKLAKDVITNADGELREYLGGGDEEDYVQPQSGDRSRDWDLELVWKRTRLRCMVYSSLGDLEEEDEDYYMEQESLGIDADELVSDVISPAVAIFLTSVMEYMGELTLTVAGQTAYQRMRSKFEKDVREGTRTETDLADRIVVEESDVERVALDRTLGRLWRGWKKRTKQPSVMEFGQRPFSRASHGHLRQDSSLTEASGIREVAREAANDVVEARPVTAEEFQDVPEHPSDIQPKHEGSLPREPENIPLPMSYYDVEEINVPGLAYNSDDEEADQYDSEFVKRPKSQLITSFTGREANSIKRPSPPTRQRSSSLPAMRSPRSAETNIQRDDEETKAETIADVTKDAPTKNKKHGLSVNTSINGVGTVRPEEIGVACTTQGEGQSTNNDASGYEKAEILTSARVSVSSGSLSRDSHQKTQSVRSARIVDVASPVGSRSPSMDATTERFRSASFSRASSASALSTTEEVARPRASEQVPRAGSNTGVRPSIDRTRPSMQNCAATISESEEEETGNKTAQTFATQPWAVEESSAIERAALPGRKSSLSPPVNNNTKVTVLHTNNWTGPFVDEAIPEVPPKSPNRMFRSDNPTFPSVEPTKTRESDDGQALSLQPSSSPARQLHTSGSSNSSATGRHKAVRTSEEHSPGHADSVARNFEELIQSNQTITYTLTPENMRELDSPRTTESSVFPRFSRSKGDDNRSRSSSAATEAKNSNHRLTTTLSHSSIENAKGRNRPSPISIPGSSFKSGGLMSPLRSSGVKPGKAQAPMISPPHPKSPAKSPRLPPAMAREARVPSESTRDFAEFIKATGPPGETRPPPVRGPNGPSPDMNAPATPHAATHPQITAHTPTQRTPDNRRGSTASTLTRHTPREAAAEGKSETSDLADFLRNGPPGNRGGAGKLAAMGFEPSIPEARNSHASTNATDNSMPSVQSSMNSHSALIKNKGPNIPSKMFEEDDMMPVRKTRRVKDPYAIDFSDEEDMLDEEEFMVHKPAPKKQEESLADFLRNYDPPPEPPSVPVQQKIPKKKASAPSLMNRFRSNKEPKESAAKKTQAQESRSLSSRAGVSRGGGQQSGHVPIQVSVPTGYDKYGMRTDGGPVGDPVGGPSNMGTGRPRVASAAASSGRVPMKKFEPRDAGLISDRSTGTSDLAAFLRDSEPPPPTMAPAAAQTTPSEDSSGFARMFSRKKKV